MTAPADRLRLDVATLSRHCARLAQRDAAFADVLRDYGEPPLWRRPTSFRTLLEIVNEQKLSLRSAAAISGRVSALCTPYTPQRFQQLPDSALRAAGMSAAKIGYARSIATALVQRTLVLKALDGWSDERATSALVAVRGIGPWTAGVYLTMAMGRPDAWPPGDRALAVGAAEVFALDEVPGYRELDALAERWRPHRGAASRLIWHAYLARRGG